jgi:hypothetical protein
VNEDIDAAISIATPDEEPAELEELEAFEEYEDTAKTGEPEKPKDDIASLASMIEFSPIPEKDTADQDESILNKDFEIVSPLVSMLSNISISHDEEPEPPETAPDIDELPPAEPEEIFPDNPEEDPEDEKKKFTP